MKLAILTPSISRLAGGMFYSVRNLSKELILRDVTLKVFSPIDKYTNEDCKLWSGIPLELYKSNMNSFSYSNSIINKLISFKPDSIYLNGIWTFQSIVNLIMSKKGVKSIIAPRGMLDEWALKKSYLQKKIVLSIYENYNFNKANTIHALCQNEANSIKNTFPNANITVIPNGIYINKNNKSYYCNNNKKFIIGYIGRLEQKKGIDDLLLAMNHLKISNQINLLYLKIAGWGNQEYIKKLNKIVKYYQLDSFVEFIGEVYGDKKNDFLESLNAFILPSYSEGLPMAVLDCWAKSIPVIMTDECNLGFSFQVGAALRIEHNPINIAKVLSSLLLKDKNELIMIGRKGFLIASEKFSWNNIIPCMKEMLINKS